MIVAKSLFIGLPLPSLIEVYDLPLALPTSLPARPTTPSGIVCHREPESDLPKGRASRVPAKGSARNLSNHNKLCSRSARGCRRCARGSLAERHGILPCRGQTEVPANPCDTLTFAYAPPGAARACARRPSRLRERVQPHARNARADAAGVGADAPRPAERRPGRRPGVSDERGHRAPALGPGR